MIPTWFNTPERIAALEAEAESWRGTPFFGNSDVKGKRGGVSCQKLNAAIYKAVGFRDIETPDVPMAHAKFNRQSLLEEFMAKCPHFVLLPAGEPLLPGDSISLRILAVSHHLGIVLSGGCFVHAMDGLGVIKSQLSDGTYASRIVKAWRPKP